MKFIRSFFKPYDVKTYIKYLYYELRYWIKNVLLTGSYSQDFEDVVVEKILGNNNGFYIDVGANDPIRFNNTLRFYKKGWRGINIEPNLRKHEKITRLRSRDINLNIGVASKPTKATYYKFMPDTLSTFSIEDAEEYMNKGFILEEKIELELKPLSQLMEEIPEAKSVTFLSVDTEGYDIEILKGIDWNEVHPKVICVETDKEENIRKYLEGLGYFEHARNSVNSIYVYKNS